MSERFGSVVGVAVSAMTGVGGEACALASGCGKRLFVAMTERLGSVVGVAMFTHLTGMSGVTAVFAVGLGYFIIVVVSELCNLLGVGVRRIVLTGIGLYALVGAGGC